MAIIKRAQSIARTPVVDRVYSDFAGSMYFDPNTMDLVTNDNEDAVKASIRNLILTNRGERLFNPTIGSDITSVLFENFSPQTESMLRDYIRLCIDNFEPRATIIDVIVTALEEVNAYSATIVFSVINKTEPITLDVLLDRIR